MKLNTILDQIDMGSVALPKRKSLPDLPDVRFPTSPSS